MDDNRYAITFGEVAILHVGGSEIGVRREHGFSVQELEHIADHINEIGGDCELWHISDALPEELRDENLAATLIIREGAGLIGVNSDDLFEEQRVVPYDKKYFDCRRRKMLNKRARYNVVFGDEHVEHSSGYKQSTVVGFNEVPELSQIREGLVELLGESARDLNAEGNHYYESKSGIGFHGDAERKVVVCLSLGKSDTLRYYWRTPGSSTNEYRPVDIDVHHGDIYVMSEKATGYDWRFRSKTRCVHACGHAKYIL